MPDLLVAKTLVGDPNTRDSSYKGWYSDGAYTGRPSSDVNGYGAHEAPDANFQHADDDGVDDQDPQEAYYQALLERFAEFRAALAKSSPSPSSSRRHSPLEAANPSARQAKWSYSLRRTAPTTAYLQSLSQERVILGLERLESILTPSNLSRLEDCRNLGAWAWSLVGKCRDVGEMSSEDVGALRQLGKTALWVARKMRMRQVANGKAREEEAQACSEDSEEEGEIANEDKRASNLAADENDQEDGPGPTTDQTNQNGSRINRTDTREEQTHGSGEIKAHDKGWRASDDDLMAYVPSSEAAEISAAQADEACDLEQARERLLAKISNVSGGSRDPKAQSSPDELKELATSRAEIRDRAFGTLDIIVTIVGEIHGQRDLLDAREVWGEYD